ncbi:hypothetical protein J2S43_007821 [Catenuloplanes nepalensis]|uniref:Uncharacterized protein n=1 Tax=Catenuloplanes nepalensis TaxID=587533 RepID=A0ABT9N6J8_9ACTN|nr:hypothetical protein [Catenuloplanes nepalensis]MDP9799309.1 hypothetical protein [Catenuloplanes nepalensis]
MTDQPAGFPPPQQQPTTPGAPAFGAPAAPGAPGAPGAPQGQPQQGFGAAPDGQAGFGAAPGQPPAFGAPGYAPPPQEPQKSGGKGRLAGILGIVGVVAVGILIKVALGAGVGAAANAMLPDPTKNAKVGECVGKLPELAEGETDRQVDVGIVDCNSADAQSTIVGRVDNLTLLQAQEEERCVDFLQEGQSGSMIWPMEAAENEYYVLCLADK